MGGRIKKDLVDFEIEGDGSHDGVLNGGRVRSDWVCTGSLWLHGGGGGGADCGVWEPGSSEEFAALVQTHRWPLVLVVLKKSLLYS